jgi:radical SAM-linked protein
MKLIICFKKTDNAKYISHLDLQRTVDRALRRSGVEVSYSAGYNPHIQMSFAFALKVGLKSDSEYLEVEVKDGIDVADAQTAIMRCFPKGVDVNWVKVKKEGMKKLMASVAMARYDITFGCDADFEKIAAAIESVLALNEMELEKKTKKGPKTFDARPLIYKLNLKVEENKIDALLSAQEKGTLDPALLMKKIMLEAEQICEYTVKRTNLYTVIAKKVYPLSFLAIQ